MTDKELEILYGCFLFAGLPAQPVQALCGELTPERAEAGTELYSAHRFCPAAAILLSGQAEVYSHDRLVLNRLTAGDCFGVAAVFNAGREYVTTVAATAPVTLVYLSDSWLRTLFARLPGAAVNYISFLSDRICFLNRKIDGFTANSSQEAVALWLSRHARQDARVMVDSYTRLARELNLGRASLYRALDTLERGNVLRREGKTITLLTEPLSGKEPDYE